MFEHQFRTLHFLRNGAQFFWRVWYQFPYCMMGFPWLITHSFRLADLRFSSFSPFAVCCSFSSRLGSLCLSSRSLCCQRGQGKVSHTSLSQSHSQLWRIIALCYTPQCGWTKFLIGNLTTPVNSPWHVSLSQSSTVPTMLATITLWTTCVLARILYIPWVR